MGSDFPLILRSREQRLNDATPTPVSLLTGASVWTLKDPSPLLVTTEVVPGVPGPRRFRRKVPTAQLAPLRKAAGDGAEGDEVEPGVAGVLVDDEEEDGAAWGCQVCGRR